MLARWFVSPLFVHIKNPSQPLCFFPHTVFIFVRAPRPFTTTFSRISWPSSPGRFFTRRCTQRPCALLKEKVSEYLGCVIDFHLDKFPLSSFRVRCLRFPCVWFIYKLLLFVFTFRARPPFFFRRLRRWQHRRCVDGPAALKVLSRPEGARAIDVASDDCSRRAHLLSIVRALTAGRRAVLEFSFAPRIFARKTGFCWCISKKRSKSGPAYVWARLAWTFTPFGVWSIQEVFRASIRCIGAQASFSLLALPMRKFCCYLVYSWFFGVYDFACACVVCHWLGEFKFTEFRTSRNPLYTYLCGIQVREVRVSGVCGGTSCRVSC